MTAWLRRAIGAGLVALGCLLPGAAFAQTAGLVHGETSEFATPTLTLVWAVQRGASGDATMIVIRAVNVAGAYSWLRVDGVDPFTKERVQRVAPRPFGAQVDLQIARAKFTDHPSTEIRLYHSAEDESANRPALTVFYLGVPDTAPEFADATRMEAHLAAMSAKARPR